MKTVKVAVTAALIALVATQASANYVYRATKPYWWDRPAMKCDPPNAHGVYWCGAGAWQIGPLMSRPDSLAAWAFAAYDPQRKNVAISIQTIFDHRNLTLRCANESAPLAIKRERIESQGGIVFEYWIWVPRAHIKVCLRKPLKMTVDGRIFRLDTKLLRQAVDNAIDRAEQN